MQKVRVATVTRATQYVLCDCLLLTKEKAEKEFFWIGKVTPSGDSKQLSCSKGPVSITFTLE